MYVLTTNKNHLLDILSNTLRDSIDEIKVQLLVVYCYCLSLCSFHLKLDLWQLYCYMAGVFSIKTIGMIGMFYSDSNLPTVG